MGESTGKRRKRYVDLSSVESKIYLIHVPGYCFDECKVLGDFGDKYANGKTTMDRGNPPVARKKINRQQENYASVNNVGDEILLNKTKKVSTAR